MASVLEMLEGFDGPSIGQRSIEEFRSTSTYKYAEKVFRLMDNDRDGEITVEEFIKGYQKLRARQSSSSVTVTAYVEERKVEKNSKPEPAIKLKKPEVKKKEPKAEPKEEKEEGRRKSLKDVSKVKSLFGARKPKTENNNIKEEN